MELFKQIFPYSQSILAILLTLAIVLQNSGVGLSSAFGGSDLPEMTKRGPEKFLFYSTMVLALILIIQSVVFLAIS